jgi:hypothetical protein
MCVSRIRIVSQTYSISLISKDDTLYIMAGLGLLDIKGEDLYRANEVTQHLVAYPTKIQGILHL